MNASETRLFILLISSIHHSHLLNFTGHCKINFVGGPTLPHNQVGVIEIWHITNSNKNNIRSS